MINQIFITLIIWRILISKGKNSHEGKNLVGQVFRRKKNPCIILLLIRLILVWVVHLKTTKLNITFNLSYLHFLNIPEISNFVCFVIFLQIYYIYNTVILVRSVIKFLDRSFYREGNSLFRFNFVYKGENLRDMEKI